MNAVSKRGRASFCLLPSQEYSVVGKRPWLRHVRERLSRRLRPRSRGEYDTSTLIRSVLVTHSVAGSEVSQISPLAPGPRLSTRQSFHLHLPRRGTFEAAIGRVRCKKDRRGA